MHIYLTSVRKVTNVTPHMAPVPYVPMAFHIRTDDFGDEIKIHTHINWKEINHNYIMIILYKVYHTFDHSMREAAAASWWLEGIA